MSHLSDTVVEFATRKTIQVVSLSGTRLQSSLHIHSKACEHLESLVDLGRCAQHIVMTHHCVQNVCISSDTTVNIVHVTMIRKYVEGYAFLKIS